MATLYVTAPGARIEREYQHLLVSSKDAVLLRVPIASVSHVVLIGRGVGATTPAMHGLLAAGIPLSLVDHSGRLLGRLVPPTGRNLPLRRRQYERAGDPGFCLAFSRQLVRGKLANGRTMARRWRNARPDLPPEPLSRLEAAMAGIDTASDLTALRAIEGAAGRAYFALLRASLRPEFAFPRRARRPPTDPVNALLSFGYTLLGEAVTTALEVVGLDPFQGLFHADKYGRPALALDLMEEFRTVVVDSVVVTLVNKRIMKVTDFEKPHGPNGPVFMTSAALRKFIRHFAHRLQTTVVEPQSRRALSYQKWFEVQARRTAKCIMSDDCRYQPFHLR